jgi:cytochrome c oxidase subunit I
MPRFYRIQTGLFRKYLFSLDHKVIGLQYALTSLIFLLIGFGLAIVFRWQLAYPGKAVPLVAMQGTIMVFLAVVPLSVGRSATTSYRCRSVRRTWRSRA